VQVSANAIMARGASGRMGPTRRAKNESPASGAARIANGLGPGPGGHVKTKAPMSSIGSGPLICAPPHWRPNCRPFLALICVRKRRLH